MNKNCLEYNYTQTVKDSVRLDIDNRVDQFIQSDAYVTVKDHKPNFLSKIEC